MWSAVGDIARSVLRRAECGPRAGPPRRAEDREDLVTERSLLAEDPRLRCLELVDRLRRAGRADQRAPAAPHHADPDGGVRADAHPPGSARVVSHLVSISA